jgi:hypothetical protein
MRGDIMQTNGVKQDQNRLEQLISDLEYLEKRLGTSIVAQLCLAYVLANQGLIEFYLEIVYERMTEEERRSLSQKHQLEFTAAGPKFREIALSLIEEARQYWISYGDLTDVPDQLHMLLRALYFARFRRVDHGRLKLLMHPVSHYDPSAKDVAS